MSGRDHRELPDSASLLFRGLSWSAKASDIRYATEKYGEVVDVYLPLDFETKRPRGIGFVEFVHKNDAEICKAALDGVVIDGREISVVYAEKNRRRPDDFTNPGRGRGTTHFNPNMQQAYLGGSACAHTSAGNDQPSSPAAEKDAPPYTGRFYSGRGGGRYNQPTDYGERDRGYGKGTDYDRERVYDRGTDYDRDQRYARGTDYDRDRSYGQEAKTYDERPSRSATYERQRSPVRRPGRTEYCTPDVRDHMPRGHISPPQPPPRHQPSQRDIYYEDPIGAPPAYPPPPYGYRDAAPSRAKPPRDIYQEERHVDPRDYAQSRSDRHPPGYQDHYDRHRY